MFFVLFHTRHNNFYMCKTCQQVQSFYPRIATATQFNIIMINSFVLQVVYRNQISSYDRYLKSQILVRKPTIKAFTEIVKQIVWILSNKYHSLRGISKTNSQHGTRTLLVNACFWISLKIEGNVSQLFTSERIKSFWLIARKC